jgi:hypothetical protein
MAAQQQLDLNNLMKQHASKSQDHKYLEQIEVLRSPYESQEWRDATVEKKRKLVIEIDKLRRAIIAIDPNAFKTGNSAQSGPLAPNPASMNPTPSTQLAMAAHFQPPIHPQMYAPAGMQLMSPASATFPSPPFMMYGQPLHGVQPYPVGPPQMQGGIQTFTGTNDNMIPTMLPMMPAMDTTLPKPTGRENTGRSPTTSRRSHAVEIKPPNANNTRPSTLDPTSPTYEPGKFSVHVKSRAVSAFQPPTPTREPTRDPTPGRMFARGSTESLKNAQETLKRKGSMSSVSTGDFFPLNTHEHSMTKTGPVRASLPQQCSREELSGPITPDKKTWGSLPVSRSAGKSRFSGFFETPSARAVSFSAPVVNSPLGSGNKSRFATDSLRLSGGSPNSALGTGREQSPWFYSASKKTTHVPSTFQEGYQAGIQHMGLPLDAEVIRGYMNGLKDLLGELTEKGTNVKISNHLTTPLMNPTHDSGVSLSFTSGANSAIGQENRRRMSTTAGLPTPIEGLGQSPNSSMWTGGKGIKYTLCNEVAELTRHSRVRKTDPLDKVNEVSPTTPMGIENEGEKGKLSSALYDQQHASTKSYPMQLSGNQAAARGVGGFYVRQPTSGGKKESPSGAPKLTGVGLAKSAHEQRYSGFDGAMDDLQELVENNDFHHGAETNTEATCFKGYSSKGKQKATSPPPKSAESPKKSGEQSPAKAKLEQIANSFRPHKKDDRKEEKLEDPSVMTLAQKRRWREDWRKRFDKLATREREEIRQQEYLRSRNMNQN